MSNPLSAEAAPTVAIIGAGGFLGSRLAQLAAVSGKIKTVPILRSFRGLARLGAAAVDASVLDTRNQAAVAKALARANSVINATMGDSLRILQDTQTLYHAALEAGVQQFIHLSSAVVYGRVKEARCTDDSPPDTRSWMLYARGKARAELWLRERLNTTRMGVVVLRPGLIWGPGSNWSQMVGQQLLQSEAVLSNGGEGIANLVYVDNLARMLLAVIAHPRGPSGFYNVRDNEVVTWRQYYAGLAVRLGYASGTIELCSNKRLPLRPSHAIEWGLQQGALLGIAKWLFGRLGAGTKAALRSRLKAAPIPPGTQIGGRSRPLLSRAHWVLQNTVHPLPATKFHRDFGPLELIGFDEALDSTAAWLAFAGYAAPPKAASLSTMVSAS